MSLSIRFRPFSPVDQGPVLSAELRKTTHGKPPRRTTRAAPSSSKPAPSHLDPPKPRRSKLARENDISGEQEAEIKEAFSLFAVAAEGWEGQKEGVIAAADVRRCLIALGIAIKPGDVREILGTLDPEDEGFVPYPSFLAYAAIRLHHQHDEEGEEEDGAGASDADGERAREVLEAYRLFTRGQERPITIADLRRIARDIREEVSDEVLKDMLVEANGEAGKDGWRKGVGVEDFESVMRRAGVF